MPSEQLPNKVYIRTKLSPARSERFYAAEWQIPIDLDDAYRRLRDATAHDPAYGAAWKLGGTTPATQAAFKTSRVYFGCLHEQEIMVDPKTVSLAHLCEIKGEVEVALRLSDCIEGLTPESVRSLSFPQQLTLFDFWCIALEMPASAILNLPEAGLPALIADRCAAGCLILAPPQPKSQSGWRKISPLVLESDGEELAHGSVATLVRSPLDCLVDFLAEALRCGFSIAPGQWVSTGGLTPCVSLEESHRITVKHGGSTALDFILRH